MDQLLTFLQEYGIIGLTILSASFSGTFLIKYPLKKFAEKFALKNGVDKVIITVWFSFIPIIIAFIGSILHEWGKEGWGNAILQSSFGWTPVMVETLAIGMTSIGMYDILCNVKKVITSNAIKKNADETSKEVQDAYATLSKSAITEADRKKTEEKLKKLQAKQEKAEKARLAQVERLKAQLAQIEGATTTSAASSESKKDDGDSNVVTTR